MRRYFLRILIALSLPPALFWTLGLLLEGFLERTIPAATGLSENTVWAGFLFLLYAAIALTVAVLSKSNPGFMCLPSETSVRKIATVFLVSTMLSYIAAAIITFTLSSIIVPDDLHNMAERPLLITLISPWLPLWWALPISAITTGILMNKKTTMQAAK